MRQQEELMKFDPATGEPKPYPSHAQQWRKFNGKYAWLFNPWTGERRFAGDVGSDSFGFLIIPPNEQVYAAVEHPVNRCCLQCDSEMECKLTGLCKRAMAKGYTVATKENIPS